LKLDAGEGEMFRAIREQKARLKVGLPARLPAPQRHLDAREYEMFHASIGKKKARLKAGLPARLPAPQCHLDAGEGEMFRVSGGTRKRLAGKIVAHGKAAAHSQGFTLRIEGN
jgi:hypothetical protein